MMKNSTHHQVLLDNEAIYCFLKDLLDPEMYGYAVTAEVRDRARELLSQMKVETK
jgi:hypothetical protein